MAVDIDGLEVVKPLATDFVRMVVKSARWVHPDTFKFLPVWYPAFYRTMPMFKADWATPQLNKNEPKVEANERAQAALEYALGLGSSGGAKNWTTCHIWSAPTEQNPLVKDRRFYTCVGNMVRLPSPIKGLTDHIPEIKAMLRTCAFHLYGWACDHDVALPEAQQICAGELPSGYPDEWPTATRRCVPPGTAPFTSEIRRAAERRKADIRAELSNGALREYPREEVRQVIAYWEAKVGKFM